MDMAGLVAVVTGGGNGIGQGLSRHLASLGASVVVTDVEEAAARAVAAELTARGGRAIGLGCDVRDRKAVRAAADRAYQEYGTVNLLFNNAGVVLYGPIREMRPDDWDWLVAINQGGVTNCIGEFLPRMLRQQDERHIVNTASVAGLGARNGIGAYSATKAAVVALSMALREELEPHGINVSIVCPSNVRTRIDESHRLRAGRPGNSPLAHGRPAELDNRPAPLEPEEAAEIIIRGVANRDEIILTDPSWWPLIKRRLATVATAMDAFDSQPART